MCSLQYTAGNRRSLGTLVVATATLLTSTAWAQRNPYPPYLHSSEFERIAQRDGVSVYKHRTSNVIRVGAEAVLPVPPEKVQRALLDYRRQLGRIDRLSEARILSRAPGAMLVYQRLDLPVIDDRDFVLRVRWGRDGKSRWVAYNAVSGKGPPPRAGTVRVKLHRGSWQLDPVDHGSATRVRYQVTLDLGGLLPRWLARSNAAKELPQLLETICRLSDTDRRNKRC